MEPSKRLLTLSVLVLGLAFAAPSSGRAQSRSAAYLAQMRAGTTGAESFTPFGGPVLANRRPVTVGRVAGRPSLQPRRYDALHAGTYRYGDSLPPLHWPGTGSTVVVAGGDATVIAAGGATVITGGDALVLAPSRRRGHSLTRDCLATAGTLVLVRGDNGVLLIR